MNTVAVIDYGMGNLHSVAKALEKVAENTRVLVSADPAEVMQADRVVLRYPRLYGGNQAPGV